MAGGTGAASFTVAPESTGTLGAQLPSSTTFAAGVSGRPLWPSDITGCILWLPGDQIQGIVSGASLSAWTDSSASAAHAVQASAVSQGVYITNAKNSLGAVAFGNGSGQVMISPTSIVDTSTLCLVASPTTLNITTRPLGSDGPATIRISTAGGNWAVIRGLGGAATLSDGPATVGVWKSVIGFADISAQSTCTLTVSGQIFPGSVATSGVTGLNAGIGAVGPSASTFSGLIGEAIVYNRLITEVERVSLDSYLRTKWAV